MAVTATVDKFGMTFSNAYHKITRLTYESSDVRNITYPEPTPPTVDEDGNSVPAPAPEPVMTWVKKNFCHFEVATYASSTTRDEHADPIYRSHFNFEASLDGDAADVIAQAYTFLKTQAGYEDAVDC